MAKEVTAVFCRTQGGSVRFIHSQMLPRTQRARHCRGDDQSTGMCVCVVVCQSRSTITHTITVETSCATELISKAASADARKEFST